LLADAAFGVHKKRLKAARFTFRVS